MGSSPLNLESHNQVGGPWQSSALDDTGAGRTPARQSGAQGGGRPEAPKAGLPLKAARR